MMRRSARSALLLAVAAVCSASAVRSAEAQTGLYAQFTAQDPGGSPLYGGTFGFYQDHFSVLPLHIGVDFRGSALSHDHNTIVGGLGGLRASVVPHVVPFKIYGEALIGAAQVDYFSVHDLRMQYQVNGGLEYTFFPRLDWRVAEVAYTGYSGNGITNPVSVSTGVVLRLP